MSEILLSESNLERVWMDEDWNVRVEWTEAGLEMLEKRKQREAPKSRRSTVAVAAAGIVTSASLIAWRFLG